MKIWKTVILCFFLFCITATTAFGQEITIKLDGRPLSCRMSPVIENDRVLLPMRDIMEPLGYEVFWDHNTRSITAEKNGTRLYMTVDAAYATVNGANVVLDAPVRIKNDIAFVPLRFVSSYSGAAVTWREDTATVEIFQNTKQPYQISDSIVTLQTNQFQGSGVILTENGLIATNYHVLENASMVQVIFRDGSIYQGNTKIVGLDPQADIALLQIEKTGLSPVKQGGSFSVGDAVTTVSSPNGKRNTQTTGKILQYNQDIISFSAPISHGSSGGGLFTDSGQWIGMCSSFSKNQYFAIPAGKILSVPRNLNLSIQDMKTYVYTPSAPRNIQIAKVRNTASVSWEPVYDADYYRIYCSPSKDGTFTKMTNPSTGSDQWFWGFPYGFEATASQPLYLKIETVRNGKSCGISNAVSLF